MRARVLAPPSDPLQSAILTLLMRGGPQSRSELAEQAGVDPSTIARTLPDLSSTGWVREETAVQPGRGRGRPGKRVSVRPVHHLALGVKLGPECLAGAVTDLTGEVLLTDHRQLPSQAPEAVLAEVVSLARRLTRQALSQVESPDARVVGLGGGLGGHVMDRRYAAASHLLGWRHVDVAGPVANATGIPTIAMNDVAALAAGHHWFGLGREVDDLAVVTIGRGLGCGLVLGGRPYTGAMGSAGELGHIPVVPDGLLCGCGNRGCLETVVSDRAVLDTFHSTGGDPAVSSVAELIRRAREGDDAARGAFGRAGEHLGRGLASLVNLINPAMVIVAGEMVGAFDFMEAALRRETAVHAFSSSWSGCQLVLDHSGDELWARSAAWQAIRALVRRPDRLTQPGGRTS